MEMAVQTFQSGTGKPAATKASNLLAQLTNPEFTPFNHARIASENKSNTELTI